VYVLGKTKKYSRMNNQLIEIRNALDKALDDGNSIVALQNWALSLLQSLIFDTTNNTEWSIQLENLQASLRLVNYDRLKALNLTSANGVNIIKLNAKEMFYYDTTRAPKEVVFQRHKVFFSSLFGKHVSKRNLDGYHAVQELLRQHYNRSDDRQQINYTVIHSRWLEGSCVKRLHSWMGPDFPEDECYMYPSYIKAILGAPIVQPIVFITDQQNKKTLTDLQNDPDIGPMMIVQNDVMKSPKMRKHGDNDLYYVLNDMLVAIMSDTFIGTRVSSFAQNIGKIRVFLGADPESNYIFVKRSGSTIKNCGECLALYK
jgi:hypothetical protein